MTNLKLQILNSEGHIFTRMFSATIQFKLIYMQNFGPGTGKDSKLADRIKEKPHISDTIVPETKNSTLSIHHPSQHGFTFTYYR